jgi:hypothetical protein
MTGNVAITHRPIQIWPGELTGWHSRRASNFKASYTTTLDLLDREVYHLGADRAVLQLALTERDIRNDGLPRAQARPSHPGVILAFESTYGPLQYATDAFTTWQDNLRAIALGLEALRKVDRYGITRNGTQYTGFRALMASTSMDVRDAACTLAAFTDDEWKWDDLLVEVGTLGKEWTRQAYRTAAKRRHPDVGGSHSDWLRLEEAYRLLMRS